MTTVVNLDQDARRGVTEPGSDRARPAVRTAVSLLVAAGLVSAGCQQETPATAASQKPASAAPAGPAPRAVRVVPATEASVARTVAATGTLAADEQVVLGTKVVGRLAEMSVDLGSLVKQGQPIARIDTKDYQYRLDQSVAALKQARVRLGLPPDGDDDRVDATQTALVRQAKALLDQAQLNRDRLARLWDQQLVARAELDTAVVGAPGGRGPLPGRAGGGPEPPGHAAPAPLGGRAGAPAAHRHGDRLADRRRGGRAAGLGRASTSPPGRRW